jgi:hypothetical protein
LKLPLSGSDRAIWIVGAAVALVAIGILGWTQLRGSVTDAAIPGCSDALYLRDVQDIVRFNGLKEVRSDGEHSAQQTQRHCRLLARDSSGKEVRLRGSIIKVGADIQLSVKPE